MNEYYNVCKEDLDKENNIIKIHCGTRQHNFNLVVNHIGLKNQKKISVYLTTAALNPVICHPLTKERFPFHQWIWVLQWRSLTKWVRISN
jgi:hypothetical protein